MIIITVVMVYNKNGYQVMVMDQIPYQIQIILILQHQNQYQKIQIIQLIYKNCINKNGKIFCGYLSIKLINKSKSFKKKL